MRPMFIRFYYNLPAHVRGLHIGGTGKKSALQSADIRRMFLDFFAANDHVIVPSSSVIPKNDSSLLFVNAGMNQFKNILLGKEDPTYSKVANSQKCIRAGGKHNDLDEVGLDGRHHTFFEMLGSWSFGDYFQQEACSLAYKLLTEVYKLPKESLFVTYFGGDNTTGLGPDFACREIWRSIGVPDSRIMPLGIDENFWSMGDEGPCGPCTELHYSPTGKASDMIEIWNLVFMQFNRDRHGNLEPLSKKHVDTGMGFERLVSVMQEKTSNYDTDLFTPILKTIQQVSGAPPYESKFGNDDRTQINTAYRIIADHARMFSISIADGMQPGPRGSPYILRKVIRRSSLIWNKHFTKGLKNPLDLAKLVAPVAESLGNAYPEVAEKADWITLVVEKEVSEFQEALVRGEKTFLEVCKKLPNKSVLTGDKMFLLYSAHGIPQEVILTFAENRNMTVDTKEFYELLEDQRRRSRENYQKKLVSSS